MRLTYLANSKAHCAREHLEQISSDLVVNYIVEAIAFNLKSYAIEKQSWYCIKGDFMTKINTYGL